MPVRLEIPMEIAAEGEIDVKSIDEGVRRARQESPSRAWQAIVRRVEKVAEKQNAGRLRRSAKLAPGNTSMPRRSCWGISSRWTEKASRNSRSSTADPEPLTAPSVGPILPTVGPRRAAHGVPAWPHAAQQSPGRRRSR